MSQLELPFSNQSEFEFARITPVRKPLSRPRAMRSTPPPGSQQSPAGESAPANLFIGLFPDPETASQIGHRGMDLRSIHGLKGRLFANERLHMTLHFLGQFDGVPWDLVEAIRPVAAETAAGTTPFSVKLRRAGSFSGRRDKYPFVLRDQPEDNSALREFHGKLGAGLRSSGIKGVSSRLTPHVTLLYDRTMVQDRSVEAIRWTAQEFLLIQSHVGHSHYTVLDRWSLEAA